MHVMTRFNSTRFILKTFYIYFEIPENTKERHKIPYGKKN